MVKRENRKTKGLAATANPDTKTTKPNFNDNSAHNQRLKLLDYLFERGSISSAEAREKLDIYYAPARIFELRQSYLINTVWDNWTSEHGIKHRIARYVLTQKEPVERDNESEVLLFALMRQHSGNNNGHLHLAKKWLYAHGWTCDENNRKACHELIERGLIVHTKYGGLNMGANYYALTWHNISNFVGLDISAKAYVRSAYSLCNLPPTSRRKPPLKKVDAKQNARHDYREQCNYTITFAKTLQAHCRHKG